VCEVAFHPLTISATRILRHEDELSKGANHTLPTSVIAAIHSEEVRQESGSMIALVACNLHAIPVDRAVGRSQRILQELPPRGTRSRGAGTGVRVFQILTLPAAHLTARAAHLIDVDETRGSPLKVNIFTRICVSDVSDHKKRVGVAANTIIVYITVK